MGGGWVWTGWGRKGGARDGRCVGVDGGGEGMGVDGAVEGREGARHGGARRDVHGRGRSWGRKGSRDGKCVSRSCAADLLVTRTWLHHKHHCRLLRVSSQVERSMGGGSSPPCFAEARSDARGAVLQGLYDGLGCPKCAQCMRQTVLSWPKRQDCCMPEPQCLKFDGWKKTWRGPMLLHASWNGCQKPCRNGD